jgi:hypothetical protein
VKKKVRLFREVEGEEKRGIKYKKVIKGVKK